MKSKLFLILGICLFAFTSCSEITMEEKSENVKIFVELCHKILIGVFYDI